MKDVRARWRFRLEVASDHAVQLVKGVDDRQVELRDEVGRKHNSIVTVDNEWLHGNFLWQAHGSSRAVPPHRLAAMTTRVWSKSTPASSYVVKTNLPLCQLAVAASGLRHAGGLASEASQPCWARPMT